MSAYFPVFLDVSGRDALVVGAGPVAARKIESLLKSGSCVTVVSPAGHPGVRRLARQKKVKYLKRSFKASDLEGKTIVFSATNDEALNRRIGQLCLRKNILVNIVDRPALSSFISPSVVRRGEVVLAISTGGASPALAKFLRGKMESIFGREVAILLEQLKKARGRILSLPMGKRRQALRGILNDETLARIRRHGRNYIRRKLDSLV